MGDHNEMNLKRTLVSTVAALGMAASVMAPVALAQGQTAGTTTATVTLTDGGEFNIEFCGAVDLGSAEITSSDGAQTTGTVKICYLDTESWRPGFQIQLQASEFSYSGTGTWGNGQTPSIPADKLTLGHMQNPYQGQWDSVAGIDVGDIGAWAADGTGAAGRVTNHNPGSAAPYSRDYNSTVASLNTARFIAYAWNGAGTGNGTPVNGTVDGTYQEVEVNLDVPAGLPGGSYTSNLSLTYIPSEGYP